MKIISGFQTGADWGAIEAAYKSDLETGGYVPQGYINENGQTDAAGMHFYHAIETRSPNYYQRTYLNIKHSDATLIVAQNFESKGTLLTIKELVKQKKSYRTITYRPKTPIIYLEKIQDRIYSWVRESDIHILNVAGNRESVSPGIQEWTCNLLLPVFKHFYLEGL